MSRYRTKILLTALLGFAMLWTGAAFAGNEADMQWFARVDQSTYGGGPRANEGLFFRYDLMYMSYLRPEVATIGLEGDTRVVALTTFTNEQGNEEVAFEVQQNSYDTSLLRSTFELGSWYEFGYVEDHCGYAFNGFQIRPQVQSFQMSDVDIVVADPPGVNGREHLEGFVDANLTRIERLPLTFEEFDFKNKVTTWGVEWMYFYRTHPTRHGGLWEFGLGVRYMEFDDLFWAGGQGGILDDSMWDTEAENHIVGPLAFARWFKKADRWTLSAEGRFISGFNSQNIRQNGIWGSKLTSDPNADPAEFNIVGTQGLPLFMEASSFKHSRFFNEWSPGVEMRVAFDFQATRAISLGFGWTGFWMAGIARASNMINYEVPYMGIDPTNNRQDIFVNGPVFRIVVNR